MKKYWRKILNEWSFMRKSILTFVLIALFGLVVLLAIIPVKDFLWSGWLYGTGTIAFAYFISHGLIDLILRKRKSKKAAFAFAALSSTTVLAFQAVFFIGLILINNAYFGDPLMRGSLANMTNGPINLFTYLGGLSVIMIAIVLTSLWSRPRT